MQPRSSERKATGSIRSERRLKLKQAPKTYNWDEGAYQLSHIWDTVHTAETPPAVRQTIWRQGTPCAPPTDACRGTPSSQVGWQTPLTNPLCNSTNTWSDFMWELYTTNMLEKNPPPHTLFTCKHRWRPNYSQYEFLGKWEWVWPELWVLVTV